MPFVPENRPPRSPKTGYPPQDIALRKAATTRKITGRRKAADGRASARTHRADDTTAGGDPHNASRTASVPAWIFCSNERGISCKPVSCRRTDSNPTGQRHTRAIPDTPDKAPGSLPGGYSKNGSSARRPASHSLSAPRKNHTSDLTITQLAANQLSTNLEYGTVQKRSLPPYPFSKPPGHLAIPPYQSILYKYNQIVRIFVFYPDAVYSRLREIPSPHNMLF